jgi:hypothetical protein
MKKLLLFSFIGALGITNNAKAQFLARKALVIDAPLVESNVLSTMVSTSSLSTAKSTIICLRNYDYSAYAESISTTAFQGWSVPIWQDSTIRQNFTSGLGAIDYSSVAQSYFPMDYLWNDVANPNFVGKIKVTNTNSYVVDSVSILGFYLIGTKASVDIVDTLVISVAHQPATNWVGWFRATSAWASAYLPTGKDTLKTTPPIMVDSVQRMALCNPSTIANVVIKMPLTAAMRISLTSTSVFQGFSAKVPGTFTVPAGNAVVVSYTFRSGDTWAKNVDTITERHHFRAGFAYPGTGGSSPVSKKQTYEYYKGNRGMSSLMMAKNPNSFTATVAQGAVNDTTQWFSQFLLGSISVYCPSCYVPIECDLSEKEHQLFSRVNAFPNPSSAQLSIPFTVKEKGIVSVSLFNMMGQVVARQNLNVQAGQENLAIFNTSNLASGVYLYALEADGQRFSDRVSIEH